MARYTNIYTNMWGDNKLEELSDSDKLFWIYLLTNNSTNLCGYYILPSNSVLSDLGKTKEQKEKHLAVLSELGLIEYDTKSQALLIKNYLKYNTLKGANQYKAVAAQVKIITPNRTYIDFFLALCKHASDCIPYMGDHFKEYVKMNKGTDESPRTLRLNTFIDTYYK